jgi:hypothetical protein
MSEHSQLTSSFLETSEDEEAKKKLSAPTQLGNISEEENLSADEIDSDDLGDDIAALPSPNTPALALRPGPSTAPLRTASISPWVTFSRSSPTW